MRICNGWVCRIQGNAVCPTFGHLHLAAGRLAGFEAADFRAFLREQSRTAGTPGGGNEVSPSGQLPSLDADGRVVTIPLVNFHDHLYSRLARGLSLPGAMDSFPHVLEDFWWRLDAALDREMVAASACLGALEALRCGVLYLFDHHCSPNFIEGSLDSIAAILTGGGLRSVLCFETSDRNGLEVARRCLEENRRFLQTHGGPDTRGLLGLHAPFTLSEDTLQAAATMGAELGIGVHTHLAEDRVEEEHSRAHFGEAPARRLRRHGLLDRPGILAHGVHLTEEELDLIADSPCALALNPDSNLNNAVGLAPLPRLAGDGQAAPQDRPVRPALAVAGTDGMHASPARTLKQLFLLHRHQGATLAESFAWARRLFFDQQEFVRRFFPDFPSLADGERGDLVVWDYRPPSPLRGDNFWGHWVHGLLEAPVWAVLAAGRPLLAGGRFTTLDPAAVGREAARQGERLFEKLGVMQAWPT
jgi:cytosine/adenosine deaminase-related metal-dependent hydrolase